MHTCVTDTRNTTEQDISEVAKATARYFQLKQLLSYITGACVYRMTTSTNCVSATSHKHSLLSRRSLVVPTWRP